MSQQYPQQPQQPEWGQQPTQPGSGYPPQPPKKRSIGKILAITGAVFVGLIVIGAIAGGGDDSKDSSSKDKAVSVDSSKPAEKTEEPTSEPTKEEPKEQPAADKTQAEEFKDCVTKSGTSGEKKAVKHVIKVTGADKRNDIVDTAEVFTDYTGGLIGPHASDGKLIASAFASCYESKNGLVTVYDKDGEILSNGNY